MKKKQLVGILNVTPDSYSAIGRELDTKKAIEYGLQLIEQGADVLDIGGESTRPSDSTMVTEEEELKRVIPVIEGIRKKSRHPLSIDTYKPAVAQAAMDAGTDWINDITGFSSPQMRKIAKKTGSKCVVMHMYASPHTQAEPDYPLGIIEEISRFFQKRVLLMLEEGIDPSKIILDFGIGGGSFGKTPEQSLLLLKNLKVFKKLGFPLLISLSRKSFMQKILQKPASELLSTTLALNTMALQEGASYIRVHDVAEHKDMMTLLEKLNAVSA